MTSETRVCSDAGADNEPQTRGRALITPFHPDKRSALVCDRGSRLNRALEINPVPA
jgi:hypothetical protein